MNCTVIYYLENTKAPQIEAFENIKSVNSFINDNASNIRNPQIYVNYGEVAIYKEKFDELYAIMMEKAFSDNNNKTEVI